MGRIRKRKFKYSRVYNTKIISSKPSLIIVEIYVVFSNGFKRL